MPDPKRWRRRATISDSHGCAAGPDGLAGAAWPPSEGFAGWDLASSAIRVLHTTAGAPTLPEARTGPKALSTATYVPKGARILKKLTCNSLQQRVSTRLRDGRVLLRRELLGWVILRCFDNAGLAATGFHSAVPQFGNSAIALHPLQRALFPYPDVPDDQDRQEHHHLHEAEPGQRLELHRPGEQEDGFHVEDDEQDGDNVEAHRVAPARAVHRINAAFVRHELRLERVLRTHQLGDDERHHRNRQRHQDEQERGNVVLRHPPHIIPNLDLPRILTHEHGPGRDGPAACGRAPSGPRYMTASCR